jgi:purine nucleosidase/pyrimidine-specific ribonucleoside hydrolase
VSTALLIDTDPGIDDALALLLAFASPEASVEAITTVAGNASVELTTKNVFRILEEVKPTRLPLVARGASKPLVRPLTRASHVHGRDGLGELDQFRNSDGSHRYPPIEPPISSLNGPDLILQSVAQFGAKLVIVALGPLTNLALALQCDRDRWLSVPRVIVMGGALATPGNVTPVSEFNFYVDPEAASEVLESGLPLELIPLDVTRQVILSKTALDSRLSDCPCSLAEFIADFTLKGFTFAERAGEGGIMLHDPLALAVALDPTLVTFESLSVHVECQGTLTRGMAVADRRPMPPFRKHPPNCKVAMSVDPERFLSFFLHHVCSANP